eukprot:COSAG02_NODE_48877_length_330_cov_2.948052_1_plen_20_part_10
MERAHVQERVVNLHQLVVGT